MIGLGSNRLSVCRRGGMRVTQAGKGGMEWLGVRGPRWASPYSAQATAALKAQFPTQWPTIRDYGFAHPEIVGYMNAYAPEDAKIAYSLVEGIGTRWLVGDGNSYINTQLVPSYEDKMELAFRVHDFTARYVGLWGQSTAIGSADRIYSIIYSSNTNIFASVNGNVAFQYNLTRYKKYTEIYNAGTFSLLDDTGTQIATGTPTKPSATYSQKVYIFATNRNGSVEGDAANGNPIVGAIARAVGKIGSTSIRLYPFKRNGVLGMINAENNTFYPNNGTGTFTELIETPAS